MLAPVKGCVPIHYPLHNQVGTLGVDVLLQEPGHVSLLPNKVVNLCTALNEVCFHDSSVGIEGGQGNAYRQDRGWTQRVPSLSSMITT